MKPDIRLSSVCPLYSCSPERRRELAQLVPKGWHMRRLAERPSVFSLVCWAWDEASPRGALVGWAGAQNVGGLVGLSVYVAPAWRRKGIGGRLAWWVGLAAAERWPDAVLMAQPRGPAGRRALQRLGLTGRRETAQERAGRARWLRKVG